MDIQRYALLARLGDLGSRCGRRRWGTLGYYALRSASFAALTILSALAYGQADAMEWLVRQERLSDRLVAGEDVLDEYLIFAEELEDEFFRHLDDLPIELRAAHARTWEDLAYYDERAPIRERLSRFERACRSARPVLFDEYGRMRCEQAELLSLNGRNEEALSILQALLTEFAGQPLVYRPAARLALAEAQRQLGDYAAALTTLDLALPEIEASQLIPEGTPDPFLINWYGLRGLVQLGLGRADQAEGLILEEQRLAREAFEFNDGYRLYLLRSCDRRINLELTRNRHRRALSLADDFIAEGLYDAQAGPLALLNVLRGKALVRLERIDPKLDRTGARKSLSLALDEPTLPTRPRIDALLELAALSLRDGELDNAALQIEEARSASQGLSDSGSTPGTEVLRTAILNARWGLASRRPQSELQLARSELTEALRALLDRWRRAPLLAGGVGYLNTDQRPAALAELARLNDALEDDEDAAAETLEWILQAEALGTFARKADVDEISLDTVRSQLLQPDHGALVYLCARDESWLIALDRDTALQFQLDGLDALQATRDAHRLAMLRGKETDERTRAQALLDALVPSEARSLLASWSRLTVVGTDALGLVPFSVLPVGENMLGCVVALDELPSLTMGVLLAIRPPQERSLDCVLVADGRPSPAAVALAGPLDELEFSASRLNELVRPWPKSQVLSGPRALGSAAFEAGERARVLQFIVHGAIDRERERRAGLVLTPEGPDDDGLVWSEDVERHGTADAVLLTACRSGSAPARPGDAATARLGTAFLAQGSRVVLESSSDLSLEPTLVMSRVFHERLEKGDAPAEALRRARRSMIEAGWASPAYHGPIHLTGLGHQPLK